MSFALVHSRALLALDAPPVQVEVHLANGLPSFTLVGLADTEVKEARERVRAALLASGLPFPHNKRITVSLAPADVPKDSGRFDLPIALGILAAAGEVDAQRLEHLEVAGELSLAGALRPVRGSVALALALRRERSERTLLLPAESAQDAARVPGIDVRRAAHLLDLVRCLRPGPEAEALPRAGCGPALAPGGPLPDLADVRGQVEAKRSLEIAAAGGHSLLLVGPPGTGKSMLAERLPGLLPAMGEEEALESAALLSLSASGFDPSRFGQRPLRAPHHTASAVALVGGGSPPRPGEISLAHGGVLFLDEWPEFARSALQALREPLETGRITLARASHRACYPARFQLVAAMNPCPCGYLGAQTGAVRPCRCTPDQVQRYRARLSGPLLDRVDLQVEVLQLPPAQLLGLPQGERSVDVAPRVALARERQQQRQGCVNAWLDAAGLAQHARIEPAAERFLVSAAERLGWSGRRVHRSLKVARTIADLAGAAAIGVAEVAEAMQMQRAAGLG